MADFLELDALRTWIGRTERRVDSITEVPPACLAAMLDRGDFVPAVGVDLPPLWHWLYFLPQASQCELGDDGHPKRGGFLPPVPLPRRMWAGGRLSFDRPLRLGDSLSRESEIADVAVKQGRNGSLVFVTVRHRLSVAAGIAIVEEHDIVYRDQPRSRSVDATDGLVSSAASQPSPHNARTVPQPLHAPADEIFSRVVAPDAVLLFRYSALTFNSHRIHYDRSYATQVEGYPGLVVHGPLIATLLMDLLARQHPDARVRSFSFKALSPLFDTDPFTICGRPDGERRFALWARGPAGEVCMQATAEID